MSAINNLTVLLSTLFTLNIAAKVFILNYIVLFIIKLCLKNNVMINFIETKTKNFPKISCTFMSFFIS